MSKPFTIAAAALLLALSAPMARSAPLSTAPATVLMAQSGTESPAVAAQRRGLAKYEANDLAGALAEFNEAIRLDPSEASAYANRGNVKDDMGNPAGALEDYNYAITLDGNSHTIYFNRGLTYSRMSRYPEAIADFDKSISINPEYAPAYRGRGITKYTSSQSKTIQLEGIADVRKSVELYRAQGDEANASRTEQYLQKMQAAVSG